MLQTLLWEWFITKLLSDMIICHSPNPFGLRLRTAAAATTITTTSLFLKITPG